MFEEKRKQARHDSLHLSYVCEDQDGTVLHEGMGRTLNVANGGILLETNFQMSAGNTLVLQIALDDDLVDMRGRVVHSNEGEGKVFRTGVEFVELDDSARSVLNRFMEIFAGQGQ